VKIECEGLTWQFDPMAADMNQGDVICAYTGLSLMAWYKSVLEPDAPAWNKSVRCLYWLMREQNPQHGPAGPVESVNFAPIRLFEAFAEALPKDSEPQAEEDPTMPAAVSGEVVLTPPLTSAG